MDFFKDTVLQFDEIDTLIKSTKQQIIPLSENLKILVTEKKKLQEELCTFMGSNELKICNYLPKNDYVDRAIKYTKTTTSVPMSKQIIRDQLVQFFNNYDGEHFKTLSSADKGQELYNYIYEKEHRPVKTRESVRIVKPVRNEVVKNLMTYELERPDQDQNI